MPRIERHCDGGAEIDIAEAQYQIARGEHDVADFLGGGQPIDASNELDVVGAPGRISAHRAHIALDRLSYRRIIEGQWQPNGARGDLKVIEVSEPVIQVPER